MGDGLGRPYTAEHVYHVYGSPNIIYAINNRLLAETAKKTGPTIPCETGYKQTTPQLNKLIYHSRHLKTSV